MKKHQTTMSTMMMKMTMLRHSMTNPSRFLTTLAATLLKKLMGIVALYHTVCSVKGWITGTVIEQLFRTIMNTSLLACYCVRNLWMRFAEGVGLIDET